MSDANTDHAKKIASEYEAFELANRKALEHARQAGTLLAEVKYDLPHGKWGEWLDLNFPASRRTARLFMQVAEGWESIEAKRQDIATLTLSEAVGLIKQDGPAKPRPKAPAPPEGKFALVYADPPWRYRDAPPDRHIENHYPTMAVESICGLEPPAADNCILLLWATAPLLREALQVVDAWGFEYKTHAVWDKVNVGMGHWLRGRHELLIVATRGDARPPEDSVLAPSVFTIKRGKHSAKPHEFYDWIERTFPDRNRVELFARNARDGWASWGNEVAAPDDYEVVDTEGGAR